METAGGSGEFPPGTDLVGTNRSTCRSLPLRDRRVVQPRIYVADISAVPVCHGLSRFAAQAASGIFSVGRSAVLADAAMGVGAAGSHDHRRERSNAEGSGTFLPVRGWPCERGSAWC